MQRLPLLTLIAAFSLNANPGALSPTQALRSFQVEKGMNVELAAAEPQVRDPVAMCFDERGRMYVVEGLSYPFLPAKGKEVPKLGRVALLEDANGDGLFEKRTTFADGFTFPNGILPWKGGVFVTCAPDIWFLKDTTGDGHADVRRIVLTGFGTKSSSEQLRVASPTLGPDGWVYITSGLTDANVTSPLHPKRPAITAKRQDGRFHPDSFVYEPLTGTGQFGQCFDAEGNRFVSSNRNPLMHVVLTPALLKRNPRFAFTQTVENVVPIAGKVYPLSPDTTAASFIPSLINRQHSGTYTSASGICIRGNSAFICEPAQNLVQRQVLKPTGATFRAIHPTEGRDFLASPDQWFRPVHSTIGPDGHLYICDMYRQYIDHPRYLPEDVRARLPFKAGTDQGRIWRVKLNTPVPSPANAAQQRAALRNLQIRDGLFKPTSAARILKNARGANARDRFQAALQLGTVEAPRRVAAWAHVLAKGSEDRWTRAAVFSSMGDDSLALLDALAKDPNAHRAAIAPVLLELCQVIAKSRSKEEILAILSRQITPKANWPTAARVALLKGMATGLRGRNFTGAAKSAVLGLAEENSNAKANVANVFKQARTIALEKSEPASRAAAIQLLAHSTYDLDGPALLKLLAPHEPGAVQLAAIGALGQLSDQRLAPALLDKARWSGFSPSLREAALGILLGRSYYHPPLVAALEDGTVPVHALSPARRNSLQKNKAVGARAKKVFAQITGGDRMKAYEASKAVLKLKADPKRGVAVFNRACATCHVHGSQGHAVGPNLTGLSNQPAETLLLHIVVPNHEVVAGNTAYEAETKTGETFTGLLAAETPDNLTLRMPLGITKTLARADLQTLRASSLSLMPNELEKAMTRQELADLIAFLKRAGQN